MRWTPTRAAALDPGMRPPDDGLFTGLGAGEQGEGFKTISRQLLRKAPLCKGSWRLKTLAGGRRIGTAGPFRFLFGHEKERVPGRQLPAK